MAKFYITTAIDYANAPPHLGHAFEKIQADVLARWHRQKGDEVLYLTGTDEHGAKIARAAEVTSKDRQEFVDELAERFRSMKEALNLSWDDFIRTTDRERHWLGAKMMWEKLVAAGKIYKKKYQGLYCVGHEAFVTQKDLVDGKCADHGKAPEVVEEENYFFKLSDYSVEIGKRIKNRELRILPETREHEILSLIAHEGLQDVSFSRSRKDLVWGIPVPGDETQTMYVWCDALTSYLSAIGYGQPTTYNLKAKSFEEWWPADVQVIGKDILRFHAAIWPGMLLAAGLPLPREILVHGFITVEGQKMSKTIGNVLDPFALVEKYGTDAVRYYLLREIPTGEDGDFSEAKFRERYNADLANGLGNFAARVLTLGEKQGEMMHDGVDSEIESQVQKVRGWVDGKVRDFKLHEALGHIGELISFGDAYVNRTKPWETNDKEVILNLVVLLDNIAGLLAPFLPTTAEKITKSIAWQKTTLRAKKIENLFPRLS